MVQNILSSGLGKFPTKIGVELTLPVSIPDKEKKLTEIFYFHTSLCCLKRFYKGFKKTFWGTTKKIENKDLGFYFYKFLKCTRRERLNHISLTHTHTWYHRFRAFFCYPKNRYDLAFHKTSPWRFPVKDIQLYFAINQASWCVIKLLKNEWFFLCKWFENVVAECLWCDSITFASWEGLTIWAQQIWY